MPFKRLACWSIGLGLIGALVFGAALMTTQKNIGSYWLCRIAFLHYLHEDSSEIAKESRSGESGVYYFTSYYLNGMLSAAEATHSHRLMRRIITILDRMMSTAKTVESDGKSYRAWGPFVITPQSDMPTPIAHYTLQAMVPFARAAAIIMTTPGFKSSFEKDAERYSAFADEVVVHYWYDSQFQSRVPWLDPDITIWNDNSTNMGLVATFLYAASKDPTALAIAKTVGEAFRAKLAPCNQGWIWESQTIAIGSDTDNTPGSVGNQAGVPDTSHTNREPMLMVAEYEAGIMFTRSDIERMSYTLTDSIWNQSLLNPSFSNYINGSNKPYRVYKEPGLNGPIYHGWVFVGGYSVRAQAVLLATLEAILLGKDNPSLKRNATSYGGPLALSGHLLRNYFILAQSSSAT